MSNSLKDLVWWGLVAPLSIKSQCSEKPHSSLLRKTRPLQISHVMLSFAL